MSTGADARMLIGNLLEQAGWCITNKAQVSTGESVAVWRADNLLKDTRSRPLAVLDATGFALAGGDFAAPTGIQAFTANRNAVQAARVQGRLANR